MADQDVETDREPLSPADASTANGRPPTPGTAGADGLRSEFAPRVTAARARFGSALDAFQDAAEAMREEGRPPSYQLVHALGECNREFLRLRNDLTRRATALSLTLPPIETLHAIGDLVQLLDSSPETETETETETDALVAPVPECRPETPEPLAVEPVEDADPTPTAPEAPALETPAGEPIAEPECPPEDPGEAVRRSALEVIDTVLRLVSRDAGGFPPLSDCQARASALRETITGSPPRELPPEAAELAEGKHALAGLLTMVAGVNTLTDAQWAAIHARVGEMFGRPLAVAAARGRLKVASPG